MVHTVPVVVDSSREYKMRGSIAAVGFASGDRAVIGDWKESPIGPFLDVMWAEADDWRTLFVTNQTAADFVSAIYEFDKVIVDPMLEQKQIGRRTEIRWSGAALEFSVGRAAPFPPRPDWITERLETPIARQAMKVETKGVSPTGVEEIYKAQRLRRIVQGWAVVAGRDLGTFGSPTPPCHFGFSEPPPFPSVTEVTPILRDPAGRLDAWRPND